MRVQVHLYWLCILLDPMFLLASLALPARTGHSCQYISPQLYKLSHSLSRFSPRDMAFHNLHIGRSRFQYNGKSLAIRNLSLTRRRSLSKALDQLCFGCSGLNTDELWTACTIRSLRHIHRRISNQIGCAQQHIFSGLLFQRKPYDIHIFSLTDLLV